jgi:spore germination protein GerM
MHDRKPVKKHMPPQPPATERHVFRSFPLYLAASCSAIALLAGGGLAWWSSSMSLKPVQPLVTTSNAVQPIKPKAAKPPVAQSPQTPTAQSPQTPAEQSVQIYWLKTVGDKIELAPAPVALTDAQPNVVLKDAFEKMLQGSTDPTLTSTIPADTKLQKLEIQSDGIHVDLSQEFTAGGGSTSMMGRVAQVIYTATTLDPSAAVWISVDEQPLDVLGGEGLVIDQPMTRQAFDQNFAL